MPRAKPGMVSGLVRSAASLSQPLPKLPPWIRVRFGRLALNHGPVANFFQHPAHSDTPKAKAILVIVDQVADALELDDELLGGLMVGLELE